MRTFGAVIVGVAAMGFVAGAALAVGPDDPRVTPVVKAYQRARPAVVNISAQSVVTVGPGVFGSDPFEDIFPFPTPMTRQVPVQSLGSGFIVHPAGYIVTNAHVIRRAQKITITLDDESKHPAHIISADIKHDLAVLKIDVPAGQGLPYLPLGRSDDLMVGETVIAIGNPLGLADTVTAGIVSALNRTLEFGQDVKYAHLIQIDAPINPGNSGGALLNIKGELIGINTAIRANAQNIGFAIPVDALADDFPQLLDFERINRAIFGAVVAGRHGKGRDELYVSAVRPGTPADKAGLKVGDQVVALAGQGLHQIPDYTCAMLSAKPGSKVELKVLRDGREQPVTAVLEARPKPDGDALVRRLFGMRLKTITPEMARDMRLPMDRGLVVTEVDPGGAAGELGIRAKDILFQVDRYYVKDLDDVGAILEEVQPNQIVRIGIARGNTWVWVTVKAQKGPAAPVAPAERPPTRPVAGNAVKAI